LSLVEFEQVGPIGIITLNRPEKKNAFDTPMSLELEAAIDRVEAADAIRVAILRATTGGARPVFSAGYDLSGGIGDEHGGFTERGGFELVLACDLIVASRISSFALAEVKWNLVAAAGGVFRLTRIIGRVAAMELILTGAAIPAERAYELGLVSRLAEAGTVDEVALDLAQTIAANAPVAVRLNRDAVLKSEYYDDREAWELCEKLVIAVNESADSAEGVRAFLERRAPVWTGR
jgi:enoyl-CoA hydratase